MLLSGSTNTFCTNGISGHSKQFKLIVPRGGLPNRINSMTSLGTPSWCSRSVSTLILAPNCLIINIIDILKCSYLILCHLPYNTYNMIEISIVCNNLFSKTMIHYNMSYIININIHKPISTGGRPTCNRNLQ